MNKKLVMLDGDRIVTGDELKEILTEMNFDIPDVEPAMTKTYIPKPIVAIVDPNYNAIYAAYDTQRQEQDRIYREDIARRDAEVAQVADMLAGIFIIATKVRVGNNPNGTKKYEWQAVNPQRYTFLQAAQKLTGMFVTKPLNEIDFICYNEF